MYVSIFINIHLYTFSERERMSSSARSGRARSNSRRSMPGGYMKNDYRERRGLRFRDTEGGAAHC
jgi:hypothetical protein